MMNWIKWLFQRKSIDQLDVWVTNQHGQTSVKTLTIDNRLGSALLCRDERNSYSVVKEDKAVDRKIFRAALKQRDQGQLRWEDDNEPVKL